MPEDQSRRLFLKKAGAATALAVGVMSFPAGLTEIVQAADNGQTRVTRTYPRVRIARQADLEEGRPIDFTYPLPEFGNFVVKLGVPAQQGVGPGQDIVAFNYLCSHMGCPLNGQYKHDHKMLGPCPCHFSRFDLARNGQLIFGQATQSLPQILLEASAGDVYAVGVQGLLYGRADNLDGFTGVATYGAR